MFPIYAQLCKTISYIINVVMLTYFNTQDLPFVSLTLVAPNYFYDTSNQAGLLQDPWAWK